MTDKMNILVSTNDQYVMPLTVLLQSLFDNNPGPMTVYFLCSDLSDGGRDFVDRLVSSRGSNVIFLPVGEEAFRGLPTKKYISRETYFRLLAAELLPAEVDRVLWLDADMVVNGPVDDFYHTDFEGAAVVACPHGPAMRPVIDEGCAMIGIEHPEQYFNAGVMLCNLDEWRRMGIPDRIAQIASTPRQMQFPGQDFTNLVFNGRVQTADWRVYNCMVHSVMPEDIPELREVARIIHYVGSAKPWQFVDIPFGDIWVDYYERSPFGGRPLRRTSYARMRAVWEKANERKGGNA